MFGRLSMCLLLYVASCAESRTWDGTFDKPIARPEHPRPDFRRDSFINLNTKWDFAYDPGDRGLQEEWFKRSDVWTHKIQVPFAWEAPLSGLVPPHEGPYTIFETLLAKTYRGVGWYRLRLPGPLPREKGLDWHLIFGAVDFKSTVWINGKQATEHEGGYDPFSVNLAHWIGSDEIPDIVLRVEDFTELNGYAQPVGKQGGTWYARTSGIWQTVYLEKRPKFYLDSYQMILDDEGICTILEPIYSGEASGPARLSWVGSPFERKRTSQAWDCPGVLSFPLDPDQEWDADTPERLREWTLQIEDDRGTPDIVHTYIGIRDVSYETLPAPEIVVDAPQGAPAPQRYKSVSINARPRYLRCVLDQSYYPDGIYTAPSVEAIRQDLETAKEFGFNCIRLHIKMDEPIKYHLADELGLYVIYDIPALDLQAKNVAGFKGREYFEHTLRSAIERDRNHPSIIAWTIFNENWGLLSNGSLTNPIPMAENFDIQNWVKDMVALARSLDPTRPVEDNSAGGVTQRFEHIDTDLNSFHYYGSDMAKFREFLQAEEAGTYPGSPRNFVGGAVQDGDPWLNSEFASFSTLGVAETPGIFCDLFGLLNEMRRVRKLVGYVLTQLTDLEYELNGLLNYDRTKKSDLCERGGVSLKDVLADDFIAFDWLPGHKISAAASVDVPLRYSHWSTSFAEPRKLRIRWVSQPAVEVGFTPVPFDVITLGVPAFAAPEAPGMHTLIAEVLDAAGVRACANRIEVEVTVSGGRGSITGAAK